MQLTSYPNTARLVNRFKLGADPEFAMSDAWGRYIHAEQLGMTTLQGFGCDMSGRQAEIRAYPSRFALEVVASIADSLRWLAYAYPESLQCNWNAIAFNGKDGCGGHVHFGRRRPGREKDIDVLDQMTMLLVKAGVFDATSFSDRQRNTHYGRYGDFRAQNHGYEYRTLPTQLSSPWLTYFTLVVSKLCVLTGTPTAVADASSVIALLKQFEDRDDDAAIALQATKIWGLPKQINTDFKLSWGVGNLMSLCQAFPKVDRLFFPSMLKPHQATCEDLLEHLVGGKPLLAQVPIPTWTPFILPHDVHKVLVQAHTLGHAPDIAMNLVSKKVPVTVHVQDHWMLYTPIALPFDKIQEAVGERVSVFERPKEERITVYIPSEANKSLLQCRKIKGILSNTDLFPVCRASDLETINWGKWEHPEPAGATQKKARPPMGKIVAQLTGAVPKPRKPVVFEDDF